MFLYFDIDAVSEVRSPQLDSVFTKVSVDFFVLVITVGVVDVHLVFVVTVDVYLYILYTVLT